MGIGSVLFSFQGRVRRTTYWLASLGAGLVVAVVMFGLLLMGGVLAAVGGQAGVDAGEGLTALGGLTLLWIFPVLVASSWISLALAVKRCHDRDYPGAAVLITLIPLIGQIWMLIDLGFIDGTPGPNRYGPSPKLVPLRTAPTGYAAI